MAVRYTKYDWGVTPSSQLTSSDVTNLPPSPNSLRHPSTASAGPSRLRDEMLARPRRPRYGEETKSDPVVESVERWRDNVVPLVPVRDNTTSSDGRRSVAEASSSSNSNQSPATLPQPLPPPLVGAPNSIPSKYTSLHTPLQHPDQPQIHHSVARDATYLIDLRRRGHPTITASTSQLRTSLSSASSSSSVEDEDEEIGSHLPPPLSTPLTVLAPPPSAPSAPSTSQPEKKGRKKSNKNSQEKAEEARQKLLERNRLAAVKSRQKKKVARAKLEAERNFHMERNQQLQNEISQLLDETTKLKSRLRDVRDANQCACSDAEVVELMLSKDSVAEVEGRQLALASRREDA